MGMIWVPDIVGRCAHVIDFFIPERPRAWKRAEPFLIYKPKIKIRFKDDERNVIYKTYVRHHFMRAITRDGLLVDVFPWTGPVRLTVHALFRPGKSVPHWPGREHTQDPDSINIGKLVEDALFKPAHYVRRGARIKKEDVGVLWAVENDNQDIHVIATKQWYDRDGTVVKMELFEKVPRPQLPRSPYKPRAPKPLEEFDRYGTLQN